MTTGQLLLKKHIVDLSHSNEFDVARAEWKLVRIEISEDFGQCPCGQDILEHCFIRNQITGRETWVGNVCINRFLGIDAGTLFDGFKRISANLAANANDAVIEYAQANGHLFDNEYDFLKSTKRKRTLTSKQISWKQKINQRILEGVVVKARQDK